MMERLVFFCVSLFVLAAGIKAQTTPAPGPTGPLNITAILEKAGQFTTLIKLMKSTQVANQINNQLNNSNNGMTLFAPTDNAFSTLSPGTLNSLTDQQKVSLIQFHVLPTVISMSQFQTLSNPLRTQAGDATNGQYPLNVTTMGNQVNITTGVVNTTVSNTLYSDSQLAVYQVDKVLLPLDIFRHSTAAPAPAPIISKPKKAPTASADASADAPAGSSQVSTEASTATKLVLKAVQNFAIAATTIFFCCTI